ncbi:hypothetical protein BUL40_06230 [Croceivirga radicis]|uniref:Uncharacterized protein n=1 Tax=Croceivirga radicis TaxID=1929488 RepID=A0A1V6LTB9_9FLAO|nr:hypothetical protein [Croceivirga radicis]OQD43425.1 hypothetical protein BUL40_06230 [Croceivirga radicis]
MTNQLRQVLLFVFAFIFYIHANAGVYPVDPGKDSIKVLNKKSESLQLLEENVTRNFPELDEHLKDQLTKFSLDYSTKEPEFNEEYLEEHFNRNPKTDTLIAKAYRLFQTVEGLGSFVDKITGKELLKLPIGMRKRDSTGNTVTLAISEVEFTPQHAIIKAFAKLEIPEKGSNNQKKELIFGAENIILTHDGGLAGDMRLVLLGDVGIPINGDQWLITLKGSIDLKKDGAFSEDSYIEFNCDGLKQIGLKGEVRVSRELLKPLNQDGTQKCSNMGEVGLPEPSSSQMDCYVGTTFNIQTSGWNDIFLEVDLDPFEVVGLDGWGFYTQNVVLDLSDMRGSTQMRLPNEYNAIYGGADLKLWRGFYAEEISVMLPQGIEDKNESNGRVRFGATNLILDSQGISGTFFGENVLTEGNGAAGEWAFTIEDVSLTLLANNVQGGSMGGNISVPILKQPMDYDGYIHQNGYGLQVSLTEAYSAPVFMGELNLAPNSSVAIDVIDGKVYPYANLTGTMGITGNLDDTPETVEQRTEENKSETTSSETKKEDESGAINFRGIVFEELELQTQPGTKKIQAKKFGFEGNLNLMNFPASISNLNLITPANQVGLEFDLTINLDGSGTGATTKLAILGNTEENGKSWKFNEVKLSAIEINYEKSGISLVGGLEIMKDHPLYGNGFKGLLMANIDKLDFSANGKAIFGSNEFRYWSVDIWTTSNEKTQSNNKLLIDSFVGGISNRMRKVSQNNGFNPEDSVYEPDINTGLGIRAGVQINSQNSGTFSGKAYLDMEFNVHGGLNRIGFIGEGAFMGDSNYVQETADPAALAETFKVVNEKFESNLVHVNQLKDDGNYMEASKETIPLSSVAGSGKVGVYVGIEKDFVNDTFDGEFELYIDLPGLRGGGEDNLAGYAKIHTSPTDWYVYIGTPQKRISLIFDVKMTEIEVGGYFMTGTQLPSQLDPHPRVVQILGRDMLNNNRQENQLQAGRGFAFGLNFAYRKSFTGGLFYASIEAGAGFDVMHAFYPDAQCLGRPGPVGSNGWYSMGQVYAYIYGEFGIDVNLLFVKGKFKIGEAGIAAMLRGQFPNPVYIQGYVGMYYNILGGLVKGRMRLKVEMGEECQLSNVAEGVGVPIISDVQPNNGADDVSVFAAPQAVFNYAINEEVTVDLEEGQKTFRIHLDTFKVMHQGQEIDGTTEWNDAKDAITFKPEETLPSQDDIKVLVEVSFEERVNGAFRPLLENGSPVKESKEITFQTDEAPDHIPLENIEYIYPVVDQGQFYPEEYKTGYLKMITTQDYLFQGEYEMRAEFIANGQGIRTDLSYDRANKLVFFDIPDMDLESDYEISIIAFPPGANIETEIVVEETEVYSEEDAGDTAWYNPDSDTQESKNVGSSVVVSNKKAANVTISNGAPKPILTYNFQTSQHPSFGDKISDLEITNNITNYIVADVHSLSIKVANYEYLDALEIFGGRYTNSQPLVYAQAKLTDNYFNNVIEPLVYNEYPLNGNIYVDRGEQSEEVLGVPPVRSFYISTNYIANLEENPNSSWVKNRIPFVYNLPMQYKIDFAHFRNTIANRYEPGSAGYNQYSYLMQVFPAMPFGTYKAELIYRTPGNRYQKGYTIRYKND